MDSIWDFEPTTNRCSAYILCETSGNHNFLNADGHLVAITKNGFFIYSDFCHCWHDTREMAWLANPVLFPETTLPLMVFYRLFQ